MGYGALTADGCGRRPATARMAMPTASRLRTTTGALAVRVRRPARRIVPSAERDRPAQARRHDGHGPAPGAGPRDAGGLLAGAPAGLGSLARDARPERHRYRPAAAAASHPCAPAGLFTRWLIIIHAVKADRTILNCHFTIVTTDRSAGTPVCLSAARPMPRPNPPSRAR